jgi:hypothetical protein
VIVGLTLTLFVIGIPGSYAKASRLTPEIHQWLAQNNLPENFPPDALLTVDVATMVFFTSVALFLFWRRSDDAVALLVALLFVLTAGIYSSPITDAPVPIWLAALPIGLGEMVQAAFVYLFPNGKFVPKWSLWLLLPMFIWRPAIWIISYLPIYKAAYPTLTAQTYGYTQQDPIDIGVFIVCLLIGIGGQVYRYQKLSTPDQRQQAKWVLYGVSMTIAIVGVWVMLFNVFQLGPTDSFITYLVLRIVRQLALAIVPVVFAISILRYRLWDIDFVVNRSLVYGVLVVLMVGLFGGVALGVQAIYSAATGQQAPTVGLIVAMVVVMATFQPIRNWLRRFIDKRLYHISLDYKKALKAYHSQEIVVARSSIDRQRFGEFEELKLVGRGGMGEVYRAYQPQVGRVVALKLLSPGLAYDPEARPRFLREAQIMSGLDHPGIVRIFDYGERDGQPFMAMEYVDGKSLAHTIDARGRLPFNEAAAIFREIASAITQTGIVGTLDYIAPEQIQEDVIDHRVDVYSFGVMAFQTLTGQLPFKYTNPGALLIAHLMQPPPSPHEIAADLPESVDYALLRAMAKKPAERFSSAGQMISALAA